MDKQYAQDEKLLLEIKAADHSILRRVFDNFWEPFRAYFLKKTELYEDEILEVYSESYVIFYSNIRDEKLVAPLRSRLKSYLIAIGKNLVLRRWGSSGRAREIYIEDWERLHTDFQHEGIYDHYESEHKKWLVKKFLSLLGPRCKEILELSFLQGNADDAIAEKMNIASPGAVRNKRFTCLKKLRKLINE